MELKNKKIFFLGDSITAGSGVKSIEDVYWKQLERNTGAICTGYGIGGTRFAKQQDADEYEQLGNFCTRAHNMGNDADIIVVFGGTNDYGHGDAPFGKIGDKTPETFCGAVDNVINTLINKYPDALIVFMTPAHRINDTGRVYNEGGLRCERDLAEYVDAIIEICGTYSVPVLDLFRTGGIQPNVDIMREKFMPDGLHPNEAGAARIAHRLEMFLRSL